MYVESDVEDSHRSFMHYFQSTLLLIYIVFDFTKVLLHQYLLWNCCSKRAACLD